MLCRDAGIIARYLDWAVNSGEVRNQDIIYAFGALAANRHARAQSWTYVKTSWGALFERYKHTGQLLGHVATIPLG